MDFLPIFSFFRGLCIPFLPSGRHLPLFPSIRWENLSTLLLSSGLSLSSPAYQSFLNASFFLESNSILFPRQVGFCPGRSTLDQILFLAESITDEFNKLRLDYRTILFTIDFSKAFDSSGTPPFYTNSFQLAYFLNFLVELHLSFLIGALPWFIKITKVFPFESLEVFRKDSFLALYFSLLSSMIFLFLCLLLSAALFMMIWSFGPPPPRSPLR